MKIRSNRQLAHESSARTAIEAGGFAAAQSIGTRASASSPLRDDGRKDDGRDERRDFRNRTHIGTRRDSAAGYAELLKSSYEVLRRRSAAASSAFALRKTGGFFGNLLEEIADLPSPVREQWFIDRVLVHQLQQSKKAA